MTQITITLNNGISAKDIADKLSEDFQVFTQEHQKGNIVKKEPNIFVAAKREMIHVER